MVSSKKLPRRLRTRLLSLDEATVTRVYPKKSRKVLPREGPSGNDTIDPISRSIFEFSGKGRATVVYAAGDAINRTILP